MTNEEGAMVDRLAKENARLRLTVAELERRLRTASVDGDVLRHQAKTWAKRATDTRRELAKIHGMLDGTMVGLDTGNSDAW